MKDLKGLEKADEIDILSYYIGGLRGEEEQRELLWREWEKEDTELMQKLEILAEHVKELSRYAQALAAGNLSVPMPMEENPLCGELRQMHRQMLSDQGIVLQGEEGGLPLQKPDAFDKMILDLKNRENQLREKVKRLEDEEKSLTLYHDLVTALISKKLERIIVIAKGSKNVVYCSHRKIQNRCECQGYMCDLSVGIRRAILVHSADKAENSWEVKNEENGRIYRVRSFQTLWEEEAVVVHVLDDMTAVYKREEQLMDMAFRDLLTGLYNRRYFMQEMRRLREEGVHYVMGFVDIDYLKEVNDTFGHREGDAYINIIKEQVGRAIRTTDVFARIGGDEFGLIFPWCSMEAAKMKMEKICGTIGSVCKESAAYTPSFSWGMTYVDETVRESDEEIIGRSDKEMYRQKKAKKRGNPCIRSRERDDKRDGGKNQAT